MTQISAFYFPHARVRWFATPVLCAVLAAPAASAATMQARLDGGITWQAGVNGVEIDFAADGTVERIYSKYSHPVTIADRRGIRTAKIVAEEKAKAEIVRFLEQQVATGRVIAEVESTLSSATQESAGVATRVSKVDEREVMESVTELTTSVSAGTLRGVVVLENGYDEETQEVWVVVGVSAKTLNAAAAVSDMLEEPVALPLPPTANAPGTTPSSEVRRGNAEF